MTEDADLVQRFEAQRPRLRAIATHLLGSPADAEDAVQETWLRLERAGSGPIRNLDAWLTTVVSRVSLDVLRAVTDRSRQRAVLEAWLSAVRDGDLNALLALLDEDAVLTADYGSRTQVLEGKDEIAGQAVMLGRVAAHSIPVLIDGRPGVAASIGGRLLSLMAFQMVDASIAGLVVLADPDRLKQVDGSFIGRR